MNVISQLWQGIVDSLIDSGSEIGLNSVDRAEAGKSMTTKSRSILCWLDFDPAIISHAGTAIMLPVNIYLYCIGDTKSKSSEAIDSALDIALWSIDKLAGSAISEAHIQLKESAVEIIDTSSNNAIIAASFITMVKL